MVVTESEHPPAATGVYPAHNDSECLTIALPARVAAQSGQFWVSAFTVCSPVCRCGSTCAPATRLTDIGP